MTSKTELYDAHRALVNALTEEAAMLDGKIEVPDAKREEIRLCVVQLRKLFGTTDRFAQLLGKGRRTCSRWEEAHGKYSPKLAEVRTWLPILEEALTDDDDGSTDDLIHAPTEELAGVFTARSIQARLRNASSVWAFKSRARFHAADDHYTMDLLIERLQDKGFTFNCAWIDGNDPDLKDSANYSEAKPLKVAEQSYRELYSYITATQQGGDIENRVRGFRLPPAQAAKWGFANAPASMLVFTYDKDEYVRRYLTDVDVFYEMMLATYARSQPDRLKSIERSYWMQILPRLARSYWSEVWSKFSGIEKYRFDPASSAEQWACTI